MDNLRLILVQNQNNLDKLRVRTLRSQAHLKDITADSGRNFGPYAEYWEDWVEQAESIVSDLRSDVAATAHFASELREFIEAVALEKKISKASKKRIDTMYVLALEALECQKDMITITDQRLLEHREFTHKLLLVEAIDSLNEE